MMKVMVTEGECRVDKCDGKEKNTAIRGMRENGKESVYISS